MASKFSISLILLTATIGRSAGQCLDFTNDANGITSLTRNGVSFAVTAGASNLDSISFDAGTCGPPTYPCVTSFRGLKTSSFVAHTSTTQTYWGGNDAANQITYVRTFTLPDCDTLQIDLALTNNSAFNLNSVNFATDLRLSTANASSTYDGSGALNIQNNSSIPLFYLVDSAGTWSLVGYWTTPTINAYFRASYTTTGQKVWTFRTVFPAPATPDSVPYSLASGATQAGTIKIKFATGTADRNTLGAEGITAYQAAFPYSMNVPAMRDRRPWLVDFLSSVSNRTAINPSGYLNSSLNALNPATFKTAMLAHVNGAITIAKAQNPRPQGFVFWDIEGQFLNHFGSYLAHTAQICAYSPEMCDTSVGGTSVFQDIISLVTGAGFNIAVTLRPDYLPSGTLAAIPGTCLSNPGGGSAVATGFTADVYIATDQARNLNSYACTTIADQFFPCNPGAGTCPGWTQYGDTLGAPSSGVYWHQSPSTLALIETQMGTDIDFNIVNFSRWFRGTYLDTSVNVVGNALTTKLYQDLHTTYPNVQIWSETSYDTAWQVTPAFTQATLTTRYGPTNNAYTLYPDTFSFVYTGARGETSLGQSPGTITGAVDNGSGLVRITQNSNGYLDGSSIRIINIVGLSGINNLNWTITRIDSNHYDLQGSTFSGTYVSGGTAYGPGCAPDWNTPNNPISCLAITAAIKNSVKKLSPISYRGWFSNVDLGYTSAVLATAATENSAILLTNTANGRKRSLQAQPFTGCLQVCFLRVYFATTAAGLNGSTTYCELPGEIRCYQSGTSTNGVAALDLTGLSFMRKDYIYADRATAVKGTVETVY